MNEITLTGYLGNDAQVKNIKDQKVINFSVATSKNYTDQAGEKKSTTTWVDCSMWRKTDNISVHLIKGKHVLVKGEPSAQAYIPKEGTEAKAVLHCSVEEIEFLDRALAENV